jgi:hypothetical protein
MSWTLLIQPIMSILDKIIPDADAKQKAQQELLMLQAKGELDAQLGQLQINAEEAKHASIFVAGWRPAVGWVCATSLGYVAIVEPVARFVATVWYGYTGAFPQIDTDLTMQVLLGLLGLGAFRSWEKTRGVAAK